MGQDSTGEDWEDNSRHAGDAVGSMASEAERTSWGSRGYPHAPCSGALSAAGVVVTRSVTATLASALAPAPFAFFPSFLATFAGFPRQALNRGLPLGFRFSALRHLDPKKLD